LIHRYKEALRSVVEKERKLEEKVIAQKKIADAFEEDKR
jgi:hypothetical protein